MEEVLRLRNILFRAVMVLFCILLGNSSLHAQSITASFTPDAAICGSAVVDFNATVTGSIPISDLSFDWDFGDGKPITNGQNVSHGFPVTPGSTHTQSFGSPELPFHVVLTVTQISVNKVVATVTKDVIVRPAPIPILVDAINPLKPFDNCASNPTVQNPNYTVTVNNQSQDVNTISGYQIDWGDGSVVTAYTRTDFPVTHNYTKLGLFRLKFTATGVNGCTATQTYTVKNQGNPGIGIVSGGNTSGCAPITFAFKIKGVSNNDAQTTYVWDFGDGIKQTWTTDSINMKDSTVFHTYTTGSCTQPNGYYVVKITATNACQSTEASVGGVRVGVKPIPSFKASNL
ncbi:MAG: PKD domain-containing protein, partial [Bacteroidota bacterium]|nr:PKD domain-containing protein [Bacteroidota bacterium]